MFQKIRSLLGVLTIGATLVAAPMAPAHAAPVDTPWLADSPTLSLAELGSDVDLALYGQVGTQTLTIPVPAGMTPRTLNATVRLPVFVGSGTVTASQDGRVLAQVDIPPGGPTPLVIRLDGVRVVDNAVTLLLRSYLLPIDGYCLDPTNPLRLTDASVSFAGVERQPDTVADFLPPVLRMLKIYVSGNPSLTESNAVVQLATAIVAHYGNQNPQVIVQALADPASPLVKAAGPFERHVVVSEGPDQAVSLYGGDVGMPAMLIAGPRDGLINETRLITSGVARYAMTSKAVPGPLKAAAQLAPNVTTIRDLGQPGVNATALNPQVGIALDETRIGRSVQNVRVHLIGTYTPLPDSIGAQLTATVAGQMIASWQTDKTGRIDRWVDIPDRLLSRYTTLAVQVNITGNTGRCGEFQPVTLTIDGATVVSTSPSVPPIPAGFQSLPQALMPRVEIGIGPDAFADTVRAVSIMTGLQRLSALPIDTEVTSVQAALESPNPAVIISPAGWEHPELKLPVSAPKAVPTTIDVVDDSGTPTTLTLYPSLKFGSLQVLFDGKRSLLVATSDGAVDQLDGLLQWISADVRRWSAVGGVALIAVAGRDPVTVAAPVATATLPGEESDRGTIHFWILAGGLLFGFFGAAGLLIWRSRRRGSREPSED